MKPVASVDNGLQAITNTELLRLYELVKEPVCVKCGAKLTVTSTCEFEPSISHAQCCGLSYTIGELSTDTNTAARDAACEHYIENDCYAMDGYEPHRASFKAGWDARDEEVRRLKEELSEVRQNYYEVVEQRNALVSDNKRLREALEKIQAIDQRRGYPTGNEWMAIIDEDEFQ